MPSGVDLAVCRGTGGGGGGGGGVGGGVGGAGGSVISVTPSNAASSHVSSTECLSTERRLQVMKNCLAFIFDGQISEARKVC